MSFDSSENSLSDKTSKNKIKSIGFNVSYIKILSFCMSSFVGDSDIYSKNTNTDVDND